MTPQRKGARALPPLAPWAQLAIATLSVLASACAVTSHEVEEQTAPRAEAVASTKQALMPNACGDTSGLLASSAWPMRGGCPTRRGLSAQSGSTVNQLNWSATLLGSVQSSPAILADGTVVVGSDIGKVFALDAADGHIRWFNWLVGAVHSSPAIGKDGTIYVGADSGRLHALRPTDGVEAWSFNVFGFVNSDPVIGADGTIYVGSDGGKLYAVKPNGTLKWSYATGGAVRSSPAIGPDGTIYVGSDSGYVFALNTNGSLKWKSPWLWDEVRSSPSVAGDRVYVGSDFNRLHALRTSNGTILWEKDFGLLPDVVSTPAVGVDGTLYVGVDDGKLHAISSSGSELWAYQTGGWVRSSPIVDKNGNIFFGSDDGYVYGLRPNGALLWKYKTLAAVRSSPAIGPKGEIVVGSMDTKVYSIGAADPVTDSDCDGIADQQETALGLNPRNPADAKDDPDGDGIDTENEIPLGGNPLSSDTDGDGVLDMPDLFNQTDLDGDGIPYAADNCKTTSNPRQEDADRDGLGDLCDTFGDENGGAPVPVTVSKTAGGVYAAVRNDFHSLDRLEGDQRGLLPTGVVFRLFDAPIANGRVVFELWHKTRLVHAYATSQAAKQALLSQGYELLGELGYVSIAAPAFGEAQRIRHFRHAQRGDALTPDAQQATQLLSAGYQEQAELGYGVRDYGAVRNAKLVTRFRDAASGRVLHVSSVLGETAPANFDTEGRQFSIFAGPSGWTVPLRRLRNAAGDELLAVGAESFAGYAEEGVLGYVYPAAGPVEATRTLTSLYRLTASNGRHEHRASLREAQALAAQGYTLEAIGRVAALPAKAVGGACAGAPSMADTMTANVAHLPPERASAVILTRLFGACRTLRALDGQRSTALERSIAERLVGANAEQRDSARRLANEILSVPSAQRATMLRDLAYLDPGDCTQMADDERIQEITQALILPTADTGGTDPRSLARMRAAQCEGVTYAPGAPGVEAGARAVVAADDRLTGCQEDPCMPNGNKIFPSVHGVLNAAVPAGSPAEQFATTHPKVGHSVAGVTLGPCSAGCDHSAGQACISGICTQFPMVQENAEPVFVVSNMWDIITPELEYQEVDPATGQVIGVPEPRRSAQVGIVRYQANEDMRLRCDASPVEQPPNAALEERIEQVFAGTLGLTAGKFYRVRAVNKNGSYYRAGDRVERDRERWASTARTVHVCTFPNCQPIPTRPAAACELTNMPACEGGLGVDWAGNLPRSLAECQALDPLGQNNGCPETPLEFVSDDAWSIIYVLPAGKQWYVQTQLLGVHCADETDRTNVGDDEVIVYFSGLSEQAGDTSVDADTPDLKELEDKSGFGLVTMDINDGNRKKFRQVIGSMPIGLKSSTLSVLSVGEDDVWSTDMWKASHLLGMAAGALAMLTGDYWAAIGTAAGVELTSVTTMMLSDKPDPDDPIGRAAWFATMNDIQERGRIAHDATIANAVPPFAENVDLLKFIKEDGNGRRHFAGNHPAVDLTAHAANDQLIPCLLDNDCAASSKVCKFGACVAPAWTDGTEPKNYSAAEDMAGSVERWDMRGSRADYRIYVSTSLSSRDAATAR